MQYIYGKNNDQNIDQERFCRLLEAEIKKRLGDDRKIDFGKSNKNNGIKLPYVMIGKEKYSNNAPMIYLEPYMEMYFSGTNMSAVADMLVKDYLQHSRSKNIDTSVFSDWESAKSSIFLKLINYEKNMELLADVPYVRFLDLAYIFYFVWEGQEFTVPATTVIYNRHMEAWGQTASSLYEISMKNTYKEENTSVVSMRDLIQEFTREGLMENPEEEDEQVPMIVVSNAKRVFGASMMGNIRLLKTLADFKKKDLYILPSSLHEIIVLPAEAENPAEEFRAMVQCVNQKQVSPEEFLSDEVYYFNREKQEVTIAKSEEADIERSE